MNLAKSQRLQRISLIILCFIFSFPFRLSAEYQRVPAAIHLETCLSGGVLTPDAMIKKVREAGLKVAIITDKDNNSLEYGILPLRNIIKKKVERESVSHYGAKRYLNEIEELSRRYPDMVILPGAETIPCYFWLGNPLSGLTVKNFHKNILVLGLDKAGYYEDLPSVSNHKPRIFSAKCLIQLWPLLFIIVGLSGCFYKRHYIDFIDNKLVEGERSPCKLLGVILIITGIIFLINNFPFCSPLFDQYHGDNHSLPYQYLINYVKSKGGLSFWSSPDVETAHYQVGSVTFDTLPYYYELLETGGYTGFAVLPEGMKYSGLPGGIWDMVLTQYIHGQRDEPAWAIGELDYESGDWMGETQTVLLAKNLTKEEILSALRSGRCYAVMGPAREPKPVLEKFQVWDDPDQKWVEMGETAKVFGLIKLRIKITLPQSLPHGREKINILKIISESKVSHTFYFSDFFDRILEIDHPEAHGGLTYYRLDLNSCLISNPIFVKKGKTIH